MNSGSRRGWPLAATSENLRAATGRIARREASKLMSRNCITAFTSLQYTQFHGSQFHLPISTRCSDRERRSLHVKNRKRNVDFRRRFLLRQICLLAGRGNKFGRLGWGDVTPASKEPGRARRSPSPAGRYGGERPHPKGGGRGEGHDRQESSFCLMNHEQESQARAGAVAPEPHRKCPTRPLAGRAVAKMVFA